MCQILKAVGVGGLYPTFLFLTISYLNFWCCSSIFVSEFRLCAEVPLSKLISTIKLPNSTSTTPCQGPELKSAKNDKEKVTYNSKDTLMVSH